MIDYNRKLSNERETQVPSHRMSTLVLLETLIFIKNVSVSVMLFYIQYQIPQTRVHPRMGPIHFVRKLLMFC